MHYWQIKRLTHAYKEPYVMGHSSSATVSSNRHEAPTNCNFGMSQMKVIISWKNRDEFFTHQSSSFSPACCGALINLTFIPQWDMHQCWSRTVWHIGGLRFYYTISHSVTCNDCRRLNTARLTCCLKALKLELQWHLCLHECKSLLLTTQMEAYQEAFPPKLETDPDKISRFLIRLLLTGAYVPY